MGRRRATTTGLLAGALLLGAWGCGDSTPRGVASPGLDFTLSGTAYHLGTGTVVRPSGSAMLKLYFSDQPDTCYAITFVPTMTMTTLEVDVVPPSGGPTTAVAIPGGTTTVPAAGQAVGTLSVSTGGVRSSSRDVSGGTVGWTVNADRSLTVTDLQLSFTGTADRLVAPVVTIPPCPP